MKNVVISATKIIILTLFISSCAPTTNSERDNTNSEETIETIIKPISNNLEKIETDKYTIPWNPGLTIQKKDYFYGKGAFYSFEKGDTIDISFSSQNSKVSIQIIEYNENNYNDIITLRQIEDTTSLAIKVPIIKKSIIGFIFSSKSKGENITVKINRIAESKSTEDFDFNVSWEEKTIISDKKTKGAIEVTSEWQSVVSNTLVSCNSRTNAGGSTRNVIPISPLPNNTMFLIYRIVCNNKSAVENFNRNNELLNEVMNAEIAPQISGAAAVVNLLNQIPGTAICDVYLIQGEKNRDKFRNSKGTDETIPSIKEYSVTGVNQHVQAVSKTKFIDLYLGFRNNHIKNGVDININVVAAISVNKWKVIAQIPSYK